MNGFPASQRSAGEDCSGFGNAGLLKNLAITLRGNQKLRLSDAAEGVIRAHVTDDVGGAVQFTGIGIAGVKKLTVEEKHASGADWYFQRKPLFFIRNARMEILKFSDETRAAGKATERAVLQTAERRKNRRRRCRPFPKDWRGGATRLSAIEEAHVLWIGEYRGGSCVCDSR